MSNLSLTAMRNYLGSSITSLNQNKLNGLLAEVAFREYMLQLGYADRVSPGGWIVRSKGPEIFARETAVLFPEHVLPNSVYAGERPAPLPPPGLLTVAGNFHQTGINAYFCTATIGEPEQPTSVTWQAEQIGLPTRQRAQPVQDCLVGFARRTRPYNFLRYQTDVSKIPEKALAEEFSKENLRVVTNSQVMLEVSDVDGIFYGQQVAYPLEIKEKTVATSSSMGKYFGLDIGPFVKLAFYASKKGQLHSLFVVREIDHVESRNLIGWWFITFEHLAQVASWVSQGGGTAMTGARSAVVMIPRKEFSALTAESLLAL